jgi:hypothetical protein
MSRGAAEAAGALAGFEVWATAGDRLTAGMAASKSAAARNLWRRLRIIGLLLLDVCFTAEEYESKRDASSESALCVSYTRTLGSQTEQVDFYMLGSYPEVEMSRLHLHHGHTHHHAESVSAAVSCMAK